MLTIFTTPKKFTGHIGVIQTNAITSWTLLRPKCEVILLGNEPGTEEVARKLKVRHVREVQTNEFGTPLVNSLFQTAEKAASFAILAYVNSDIILMADLLSIFNHMNLRKFLLVGRRWNVWIREYIDFSSPSWETNLRQYVKRNGSIGPPNAIDYFVFSKGIWDVLPAYTIGRAGYDNGLLYNAYGRNVPIVNVSGGVLAIHQNHDYSHHSQGKRGVYSGEEARRNLSFMKGGLEALTIRNASLILTRFGLVPALTFGHLRATLRFFPSRFGKELPWFAKFANKIGETSLLLKKLEELET
ncbi:MAG: hypothetical protein NC911_05490 [Candidatus Omnitrophica bacterium]|nr:hypothetical protein [Candidatus Omnitrophota bacterium]